MNQILALLQKLWQGNIAPHEADALEELLRSDTNSLKSELQAQFDIEATSENHILVNKRANEILVQLLAKINAHEQAKAKVVKIQRKTIWYAAAALVAFIIGFQIFNNGGLSHKQLTNKNIASNNSASATLKVVTNTTLNNIKLVLADKSIVTIYPKSSISYYETFAAKQRNISLTGKAYFNVAKDITKPFTVYANGIATTALGTQFIVSTLVKNKVEVKLFEGKVVVKSIDKNTYSINDVYLLPGQMATAIKFARTIAVTRFSNNNALVKNKQSADQTINQNEASLVFNNEPLENVIEKLSKQYDTKINYTKSQIAGLYFSGSVLKTDSLKTILNIIANMNGLVYEEVEGKIFIKK